MKKSFTSVDKARIAFEAMKGIDPLSKIGSIYSANPIQIGLWKKTVLTRSHELFNNNNRESKIIATLEQERDELHRLLGVREAELVWLKKKFGT